MKAHILSSEPLDFRSFRYPFTSVFVFPEVDGWIQININAADLRTDTYRAFGAGGQPISKTDSAVRLTHVPAGIVVQCPERPFAGSRDEAWHILRDRSYEYEPRK